MCAVNDVRKASGSYALAQLSSDQIKKKNGDTLLMISTLRAWRSVPFWTAIITSMATRAYAPD